MQTKKTAATGKASSYYSGSLYWLTIIPYNPYGSGQEYTSRYTLNNQVSLMVQLSRTLPMSSHRFVYALEDCLCNQTLQPKSENFQQSTRNYPEIEHIHQCFGYKTQMLLGCQVQEKPLLIGLQYKGWALLQCFFTPIYCTLKQPTFWLLRIWI